tara:strand:+ start:250 stop:468 length:219 start_codon:yes stop_codon:yes gene_type:complete
MLMRHKPELLSLLLSLAKQKREYNKSQGARPCLALELESYKKNKQKQQPKLLFLFAVQAYRTGMFDRLEKYC